MMSSTTDTDPYHQFQSEVQSLLQQTRTSFTNFLRLRSLPSSPNRADLASARQELSDHLATLSDDLADLTAAVKAVEKDPYQYGLDVADVAARRRFVEEAAGEVEDMKEEMAGPVHPQYGGFVGDDDDDDDHYAADPLSAYEQEQQVQIMREQDLQLDGVYRTVGNLREQAHVMGRELEEQAEMISALDTDVDRVQGKLGKGLKDLNKFIRKNEDTASNWCIGLLILVLCILLFLLIIV
ncbi:t-SNARE [Tricharina praecox]|uniref:t-SNARE n=1 Tax=Tricharina praecox TaxID=43433 RepID=UPI002220DAF9|nr:t-SNARE [Tricharina praecox]KAI5854215.1 t-SNARE [Tricharina praecox]